MKSVRENMNLKLVHVHRNLLPVNVFGKFIGNEMCLYLPIIAPQPPNDYVNNCKHQITEN